MSTNIENTQKQIENLEKKIERLTLQKDLLQLSLERKKLSSKLTGNSKIENPESRADNV